MQDEAYKLIAAPGDCRIRPRTYMIVGEPERGCASGLRQMAADQGEAVAQSSIIVNERALA